MAFLLPLLLLAGCPGPEADPEPVDLTVRLEPHEVRAGVVTDESALFGGISAEGRAGDIKMYNDRVQFVIQGFREGDYFVADPGMVVDADIVRPEGQPGRDIVDEWGAMMGIGRLVGAETLAVLEDGRDGRAVVRISGPEIPLDYIEGAVETPGFIDELGLRITTDYILEPGAWWLEVRTTVTATDDEALITPGDVVFGAMEVSDRWSPVVGRGDGKADDQPWVGYMGERNDVAIAVLAAGDALFDDGGFELLDFLLEICAAFAPPVTIPAGGSISYTRYYGVAPDLATLSDAWLENRGPTDEVSGEVTAPDGPVAGARVNVVVDGEPFTVAVTDDEGRYHALVPQGATVDLVADGRGQGLFPDHPEGAGNYSPYGAAPVAELTLQSLTQGAVPVPCAEGRGVAEAPAGSPLVLGQPGTLTVRADDGRPFEAQVAFTTADPAADDALVLPRPGGKAAWGWSRDGEVTLKVEPGTYDVLVHRGPRFGYHSEQVEVLAGQDTLVECSLPEAYAFDGWLLADTHMHSSPSPDGKITMEDRLMVASGRGLGLHFGSDHDHIADYRPLIGALGIGQWTNTVVADEVSSVIRGHMNVYPAQPDPTASNHGAWAWYSELVPDTETQIGIMRDHYGDILIQSNHPLAPGLASAAHWTPGVIGQPSHWSADIDAVEVLNGSDDMEGLEFYLDLVNRGVLVTPVGVSDSHGYFGPVGISATWIGIGTDEPSAYTDDALREAMRAQRTIVSRGAFLEMSIDPGALITGTDTLDVTAHTAQWTQIDRLLLLENGEVVQTVDGDSTTFDLSPDDDATYVVIAESDHTLSPLWSRSPWAMSAAIRVDVDGDGWTPPLPALILDE